MKIGLVISYRGSNYGMMLQALATQHYLDHAGYDTEIISYLPGKTIGELSNKVLRHMVPVVAKTSMRSKKRREKVAASPELRKADLARREQGDKFVNRYLHDIVTFRGYDTLRQQTKLRYSTVIIGSDQQWTPQCFYNKVNTLEFVPKSVNKVSYATSMGVSQIPWYTKGTLKRFMNKIDHISVRETTGKRIIESVTGREDVSVTPDPTFLISATEWENIIPRQQIDGRYIFCYFLGNNDECMKSVSELAEKTGMRVIAIRNIEVNGSGEYNYYGAEILEAPSVEEFVNYIRNAAFVCTDSFHCTVFSIINNVRFATFYRMKSTDKNSRNSRIDNLLEFFELKERVCKEGVSLFDIFPQTIDYKKVNKKLEDYRSVGANYLNESLHIDNILSLNHDSCCGCSLCSYSCPKGLITMADDSEGFKYPCIQDITDCISCGACVRACPVINCGGKVRTPIQFSQAHYAYADDAITEHSSSGGVAAGLYNVFHSNGAKIIGVSYNKYFNRAEYVVADHRDDISRFAGSKYIKADENGIYNQVKSFLSSGQKVFFVGLPCEIAALKSHIQGLDENLYTCELICHGPTTPSALEKYLKETNIQNKRIHSLTLRGKKGSWKPYYIIIEYEDGTTTSETFSESSFNTAFQIMKRPSCNECRFKDGKSAGDLVIGDFHGAKIDSPEYNKMGVSVCFPVTEKGMEMIKMLQDAGYSIGIADEHRARGNEALKAPIPSYSSRARFVRIFHEKGLSDAADDTQVKLDLWQTRYSKKIKGKIRKVFR